MSKPVSQVVRWVQNQGLKIKSPPSSYCAQSGEVLNKNWVHPPDVLHYGRVEYTVKFLGEVEVSQPKGTAVIKDALNKIRFNLELKRAQGYKLPRVELHINVDGLSIIDAKTKMVLYRYQLHRISFCADDKQDKRVFSFIAKQADSDVHNCFVFLSDKLAEEITLTIGEAFDLAYRKFLDNNGRDLEQKKQTLVLRQRIAQLEKENAELKSRLAAHERAISSTSANNPGGVVVDLSAVVGVPQPPSLETLPKTTTSKQPPQQLHSNWENFDAGQKQQELFSSTNNQQVPCVQPPISKRRDTLNGGTTGTSNGNGTDSHGNQAMAQLILNGPVVGRKLENLQLDKLDDLFDNDFDPRANETQRVLGGTTVNGIGPHAKLPNDTNGHQNDPFGLDPFTLTGFSRTMDVGQPTAEDMANDISLLDRRIAEMREGFSRGLTFGNTDFSLLDLDPLSGGGPPNGNHHS